MEATFLMGLDVGGRSGRCILLDVNSGKVFAANRCWEPHVAPGSGGFGYEIDTTKYKTLLAEAICEAMGKAGATPKQVAGIAVVSARHSSVLIGKDGQELAAYPNKDGQAAAEGMTQADEMGAELNERTGHFPMPIFTAARLQWLKNSVPQMYPQVKVVLGLSDWIAYVLTGKAATDPTQAGETCLLDLKTRKWAPDLLKKLDISPDLLPPVKEPGSKLGTLTKEAAQLFG
ncbi:MAG TPA: FGGY family carbohydrate kinase, partial [Longilinea sp.]|nr:FGGY family carbohydrate kinase [Longilinea sp.]